MRLISIILLSLFMISSCSSPAEEPQENNPTTYTVEIKGMKFIPEDLKIKKGDKVTFINKDMVNHDVTESVSLAWTSSPIPPGTSWTKVFTESADYYCSLHKVMKGKISVE